MKQCLLAVVLLLLLSSCGTGEEAASPALEPPGPQAAEESEGLRTASLFAMDTRMELAVCGGGSDLLDRAEARITGLEALLSTTDPDSEIAALNRNGSGTLSPEPLELVKTALALCSETDGALDLSIYPVVRAWGFTEEQYRVPTDADLSELLAHVDYRKIRVEGDRVMLDTGMEIDLGSVAKGFTGDQVLQLFRDSGVNSALLNLGGNVQALGARPDGTPWRIAVQDPSGSGYLGVLPVEDKAVITSGGYERFFEQDGQVYWHIMDPSTGRPARNGLVSVTVVGDRGVYCDALSTALFIMGEEKAVSFWRDHRDFDLILVTEDSRVLVTPDLSASFRLWEGRTEELEVIAS